MTRESRPGHRFSHAHSIDNAVILEEDIDAEDLSPEMLPMENWQQWMYDMQAQNLITFAHNNPNYIDLKTGDTVFHALSRVNTGLTFKPNNVLEHLRHFITKDADPNQYNCEGYFPLASFTGDRAFGVTETGTTMSMYLDAILWTDYERRERSRAKVNMKIRDGSTPLYNAAIRGRLDSVRSLIDAGANVNARLGMLQDEIH
jgi:hypothetical protein